MQEAGQPNTLVFMVFLIKKEALTVQLLSKL